MALFLVPFVRARIPKITAPFAVRLSRWSLPVILLFYLVLVLVWALLVAVGLHLLERSPAGFGELLRTAFWAMWGPDNLLARPGESFGYYVLGVANALMSVLLPIFLLGAFVFKLFRHDPLRWRNSVTVEAHPSGYFMLTVRFYNQFSSDVADVNVRAWVRWVLPSDQTVYRNRSVRLWSPRQLVESREWPLAMSGEPTTARVIMCEYGEEGDGVDPLNPDQILIQDEWIPRRTGRLVVVVTGTTTGINEEFRSTKIYSLSGESGEIQEDIFQDIDPASSDVSEWRNFDGSQKMYVFVYGSLMRDKDLQDAGIDPDDAIRVTLQGWRRRWNVASDPAAKNRVYTVTETGVPFPGMIGSLGVERVGPGQEGEVRGVMAPVDYRLLRKFDLREQDYNRADVTRQIAFDLAPQPAEPFRVFTYVPKDSAVRDYAEPRKGELIAVRKGYYDSILDAATQSYGEVPLDLARANRGLEDASVPVIAMEFE